MGPFLFPFLIGASAATAAAPTAINVARRVGNTTPSSYLDAAFTMANEGDDSLARFNQLITQNATELLPSELGRASWNSVYDNPTTLLPSELGRATWTDAPNGDTVVKAPSTIPTVVAPKTTKVAPTKTTKTASTVKPATQTQKQDKPVRNSLDYLDDLLPLLLAGGLGYMIGR